MATLEIHAALKRAWAAWEGTRTDFAARYKINRNTSKAYTEKEPGEIAYKWHPSDKETLAQLEQDGHLSQNDIRPIETINETLNRTDPVRASHTSGLKEIALACRDLVKSDLMTAGQIVERYNITSLQAEQIVSAVKAGLLDGEYASEAEPDPYARNAQPGHVIKENLGNILVIGDSHIPFEHPGYLDFCQRVRDEYQCEHIVHIGDEVDSHALSYHESDPDGLSAGHEARLAMRRLKDWYAAFPEVDVLVGNHGALPYRKAFSAGIPRKFVKAYEEIWEAPPGWVWYMSLEIDGVWFDHGRKSGGMYGAINTALKKRKSYVQGHTHAYGGINYRSNGEDMVFGLNVGCGISFQSAYAFDYAAENAYKPTLGCGVVLAGGRRATFVPMLDRKAA